MATIVCSCDRSFEADLPDSIDLDREESRVEEILSGNFLAVTCPNCGRRLKPELRIRLISASRGLNVLAVPEGERIDYLNGGLVLPTGVELLIGFAELYERALVLRDGLEAGAVEVLKYYLLAKALQTVSGDEEPLVRYGGKKGDGRLEFRIEGLRKDEVALLALPFDRYEKALRDYPALAREEPFSEIFAGPYKSVRALEAD